MSDNIVSSEILEMSNVLGLSQREFKALMAIGLHGLTNPTDISNATGIVRSKIYEILESLREKEILTQEGSKYYLSRSYLTQTIKDFEKKSDMFLKFLKNLEQFSFQPNMTYLEFTKNNIKEIFVNLRYDISDLKTTAVLKKYAEKPPLMGFVATSPDSGNKVGVILLESTKLNGMGELFAIFDLLENLEIHVSVIVYSQTAPKEFISKLKTLAEEPPRFMSHSPYRRIHSVLSYSEITNEKLEQLSDYFIDFDIRWRHAINDLQRISPELESFKRTLARAMTNTFELKLNIEKFPLFDEVPSFIETLREVVERVSVDIKLYGESIDKIKDLYTSRLRVLENKKILPEEGQITMMQRGVSQLQENISKSNRELDAIKEEFGYYQKQDERYLKYGFRINPFIFTVPFTSPETIVNQEEAKKFFDAFIHNIEDGSENRTLIIADEFGKGKTHLMLYFKKLILDKKYSKILPIYIKCPPRYPEVDLIDLYSQIVLDLKTSQSFDKRLAGKLDEIVTKIGTPRDTTEFISAIRDILMFTYESGYNRILLMVDEFENMLPEYIRITKEPIEREPRTLLQLKSFMEIQDVAFVFTIRKQTWLTWNELISKAVNYKEMDEIELEAFDEENTKQLINQRMNLRKPDKKQIQFSDDAIKNIVTLSKGIPREIIRYSREGLRKAILKDKTLVEGEDIIQK